MNMQHASGEPSRVSRRVNGTPSSIVCQGAGLLAAAVLLIGVHGCQPSGKGNDAKPEAKPVTVRVAKAELRTLRPVFEVIGTVVADPQRVALINSPIPGLVVKLVVAEGKRVKKDDLILQLDEQKAETDLARAKAIYGRLLARSWEDEVNLAKTTVDKARAAHGVAKVKLKGAIDLRKRSPELVPELQLKEEERNEQFARADLEAAEAQVRLLKKEGRVAQEIETLADVKAAELQLKWCKVLAPLDGEVTEIKARVGQRTDAGTPLAATLDTSEVQVQARVPGKRLESLTQAVQQATAAGQEAKATVRSPAFPGVTFPATVIRIGQQTEALTADVPVWVKVSNPKGYLRVGMVVQLDLFGAAVKDLAIPDVAMTVNEEGKRVVTVIRAGKAFPAEIEIVGEKGPEVRADGWVRVLKGLREGDDVAVENGYALPEGFPVTILSNGHQVGHSDHK